MKNWMQNVLITLIAVPTAWLVLPKLLALYKKSMHESVLNFLRRTKVYWKGHEGELEKIVDEADSEVKSDIEEVSKEDVK